jgi:hypothetical protein
VENTEKYSNQKLKVLRRKRETWKKGLESADKENKWFYDLQITVKNYEIEDAVKSEAKRKTRLALKKIKKKQAEIQDLREVVNEVLFQDGVLDFSERINFQEELGKTYDRNVIYGGRH